MDDSKKTKSNTSERLKEYISIYGITQTELVKRTGLSKSTISQWINGVREPKQDGLYILGQALNVNPAWLMGFNVPMNVKNTAEQAEKDLDLITKFAMLNPRDQEIVMNMIDTMLINKKTER